LHTKHACSFDLIFLDANKDGYGRYYGTIRDHGLLASGGLLVVDNTLMKVRCVREGLACAHTRARAGRVLLTAHTRTIRASSTARGPRATTLYCL
jgi:predicted O-methyltransferase YrrM